MAEEQEEGKTEEKKKAGLGTGAIIGIISGALIVQAIIVVVAIKLMAPATTEPAKSADAEQVENGDEDGDELDEDGEYAEDEEYADEEEAPSRRKKKVRHIVQLENILVNPKGSSSRYVSVTIGLEVKSEEEEAAVEKLMVPIMSTIRRNLASKTIQELEIQANDETLLAKELLQDLRPYFREVKLYSVYIPKFIIQ